MICIKCGKRFNSNDGCCVKCGYINNVDSGVIHEDETINKLDCKKIIDYGKYIKNILIICISIIMLGIAFMGLIILLFMDDKTRVEIGLSYSNEEKYEIEPNDMLRGIYLGMSREKISRLENEYIDSVKEFNYDDYMTYIDCNYGGYRGRTKYKFLENKLEEIEVIFYPENESNVIFKSLSENFDNEYERILINKDKADIKYKEYGSNINEMQWKFKNMIIILKNSDCIKLNVRYN